MKKLFFLLLIVWPFWAGAQTTHWSFLSDFRYVGEIVAPEGREIDIGQLSKDGKYYYLALTDESGRGYINVYRVKNSGKIILEKELKLPLFSKEFDFNGQISLSADNLSMAFCGNQDNLWTGNDLFLAKRATLDETFSETEPIRGVNTDDGPEAYPYLSPDALNLYYTSDTEIYVASRSSVNEPFGEAEKLNLNLEEVGGVISCWFTNDQRDIYIVANSLYKASRNSSGQPFSVPYQYTNDFDDLEFFSGFCMNRKLAFIYVSEQNKDMEDVQRIIILKRKKSIFSIF